ncbi:hypothetical protein IB267_32650, partial [Ensifer sp. ENS09]|uniref:hypothetical protein n=1 Tax=Ensifer sp. ENS09 TaxID=2769263 RepID=UPI0017862F7C
MESENSGSVRANIEFHQSGPVLGSSTVFAPAAACAGVVPFEIDTELTIKLKRLSAEMATPLFAVLLVGWAIVLNRISGQDEFVFGLPSDAVDPHEMQTSSINNASVVFLQVEASKDVKAVDLLEGVRDVLRTSQERAFARDQATARRDNAWLNRFIVKLRSNDFDKKGLGINNVEGGDQLEFKLHYGGEGIIGDIGFSEERIGADTVERYVGYYVNSLRAMVADLQQQVARLDILSDEERRLLLETWNQTAADYPSEKCIHELFEEQVAKTPE